MSWDQAGEYFRENSEIIIGFTGSVAAGIGLYFTARTFRNQQRQTQFATAENLFRDLRQLEKELSEIPPPIDQNDITYEKAVRDWDSRFFNTLEWFSFLINENEIRAKKLIEFFKPAVIQWYEKLFLKHMSQKVIDDPKQYEELKKLYNRLKNDSEPSFFRMKHER